MKKTKTAVSFVFAFLAAAFYFFAVFTASIYGSGYFLNKTAGKYMALMIISVVFLMAEYIFFGRKDSRKFIMIRFGVHNILGLAGLLFCKLSYDWLGLEKQCLYSSTDVLKNVFVGKWISFVLITFVTAVLCYIFSSDDNNETNEKRKVK